MPWGNQTNLSPTPCCKFLAKRLLDLGVTYIDSQALRYRTYHLLCCFLHLHSLFVPFVPAAFRRVKSLWEPVLDMSERVLDTRVFSTSAA
jgi:hypothetical protein